MSKLIGCPVAIHPSVNSFGSFANAVRVIHDGGDEWFLDFCVYSAQEEKAEVVARIRIHKSFLPTLISRLRMEEGSSALVMLTPPELPEA